MKTTGIIYGSTTGTTKSVAQVIATELALPSGSVHDVADLTEDLIAKYDLLIFGSSTWGYGELQDDWYEGLNLLKGTDLSKKTVALFGCGDLSSYEDTFCNAIGLIYEGLQGTGCHFIGGVGTEGYSFSDSAALKDGRFVGLPLDEVSEDDLTNQRLRPWIEELKGYIQS